MKKIFIFFLLCFIFFSLNCISQAYNNMYFSISSPVNPTVSTKNIATLYSFTFNDTTSMVITVVPHNSKQVNINFTQSNIDTYANSISTHISEYLNTPIEIKSKQKSLLGQKPYSAMALDLYYPEIQHYQKQFCTISDKYIYTITLGFENNEQLNKLIDIADTFTINDTITKTSFASNTISKLFSIIILAIVFYLVITLNKKTNKQINN